MLKFFKYIIFLLLIIEIQLDNACYGSANLIDECLDRLTENEKEYNIHCCLFTGKEVKSNLQISQCLEIDEEGYENIDDFKSNYENSYNDVSIDCKSSYLNLCLLELLFSILLCLNSLC